MNFDPAALAWLIAEIAKLVINRLSQAGKLNNLTQPQAEAEFESISAALPVVLPSPEELENPPTGVSA